jgi:hypothetical protein
MRSFRSGVSCLGSLFLHTLFLVTLASAEASLKVEWHDGRLSVDAERMPLSSVLKEISRRTALEFSGIGPEVLQEEVSVIFTQLPLRDGVRRLLGQLNYAIVEERSASGESSSARVLIFGRRLAGAREAVPGEETAEISGRHGQTVEMVTTPGTALEDERAREADRPSLGRPLEDEQTVEVTIPAGTPLEDELAVAQAHAHPAGTELDDERAHRTHVGDSGKPLADEPGAR